MTVVPYTYDLKKLKKTVNESIIIDKPTHGTDGSAVSSSNSALQLKQ